MGYGLSIWDIVPYRYGHPGYRCGIWTDDVGDNSIDLVILNIDMGYLVTLAQSSDTMPPWHIRAGPAALVDALPGRAAVVRRAAH